LIAAQVNVQTGEVVKDKEGNPVLDYNTVIPRMLLHFFPSGMLGLGLTALLASFMSGMAGNVTAFNTVCTYDIYRAYIRKNAPDKHYFNVARFMTLFGVALSVGAAYFAAAFNNIICVLSVSGLPLFVLHNGILVFGLRQRVIAESKSRSKPGTAPLQRGPLCVSMLLRGDGCS